jgi:hypothetical protein
MAAALALARALALRAAAGAARRRLATLAATAGRGGGSVAAGKSTGRLIAEELALKRRAGEAAAGGARSTERVSLSGLALAAALIGAGGMAVLGSSDMGRPYWDALLRGTPLGAAMEQVRGLLGDQVREFTDPISESLLPDLAADQRRAHTRTLVLDLEDVLLHLEWDRRKGWRAVKRPGVDAFLNHVVRGNYEVVLFSSGNSTFLAEFVLRLDPMGLITYKLFREATVYENGQHVKDLSHLNRDLRNVVAVGRAADAFPKHPENAITIAPFSDARQKDAALLELLPLLDDLVNRDVPDVRVELARLKEGDSGNVAQEFNRQQRARMERAVKERQGTLGSLIGSGLRVSTQALAQAVPQPQLEQRPMTTIEEANQLKNAKPLPPPVPAAPVGSFWGSVVGK